MASLGILAGQKALVTGANSGIGQGVAVALGRAGADVVVNYVEGDDAANRVVNEIRQGGVNALAHKADVSNEAQVAEMFEGAIKAFGTIDILVNNAGLQRDAPIQEMTLEKWNKVIGVNLTGQFLCARAAAREFLRRGVIPSVSRAAGKIICMSSVHQTIPWGGHANYATSKGGIKLLMESMAQELAPHHIRVNAIAPSTVLTESRQKLLDAKMRATMLARIPTGKFVTTDDVAAAVVFLVSPGAASITGTTLPLDGGLVAN